MHIDLPPGVVRLFADVRSAGGWPFVVGGAVRDSVLGLPLKAIAIDLQV